MSLLAAVVGCLQAGGVRCALIGAGAMAAHGVTRGTRDLDLLVVDRRCLDPAFWDVLEAAPAAVSVRAAAPDDPLGGVVRVSARDETVDVVVGKTAWQARVLDAARLSEIDGVQVPVAGRLDLILLKLYAGGPQDAWDIEQLLHGPERAGLAAEVDRRVADLPEHARQVWRRIRPAPEA